MPYSLKHLFDSVGFTPHTAELAEANLSLARKAAIVEYSNDAILGLDLDGRIMSLNPAAKRVYGYPEDEILGRPFSILVPPSSPIDLSGLMERLKGGEYIKSLDTVCVRKSGELIQVEWALSSLRNEAGEIEGASLIAREISERKRADDILRLTVEAAPNAMVMADEHGKIVLVNGQTEKLFGYQREELVGQSVDILVPHRYRDMHPAQRSEFMRRPEARRMGVGRDLHGLRKDGSQFSVEIGLNPIRTEQGNWVLSAIVDITERKRADDMLRLAVEASPSAMVMTDAGGKIILVNSQTEELFGYAREELLGQDVNALVPHRFRTRHSDFQAEFMANPHVRDMTDVRGLFGLRKDGSEFPAEIGLNPIDTEHGVWVLSAIVDITERKRVEEQRQRLNEELESRVAQRTRELTAANAELDAFSYTVSHDLRAPLRQVAGFANILAEEHASGLTPEFQRYLQRVQDGAQQMGALIDDLLNLARIGRKQVARRMTPLNGLVTDALKQLNPGELPRRIDWRIESMGSVECDPGLLKLVFVNLLSNAIKYTRPRELAVIHVGQTTLNEEPVVFVTDNGTGFDMAYASKLFGVFQRLHKAKDFEGTGVGLATVQRIIHKHGGRVWADAAPGRGASFMFTIPPGSDAAAPQTEDSGKEAAQCE